MKTYNIFFFVGWSLILVGAILSLITDPINWKAHLGIVIMGLLFSAVGGFIIKGKEKKKKEEEAKA